MDASRGVNLWYFLCAAALVNACSSDNKAEPSVTTAGAAGAFTTVGAAGSAATGIKTSAGAGNSSITGGYDVAGAIGAVAGAGPLGSGGSAGNGVAGAMPVVGAGTNGVASGGASPVAGRPTAAGSGGVAVSSKIGGAAGQAGGAGSTVAGAAGSPSSNIVWSWGQKGNEGPLTSATWVVDNALGANEGSTAAHPPAIAALTTAELTIDCGTQSHTQLSFYLKRKTSGPALDFLVDGTRRFLFASDNDPYLNGPFEKYVFDVPEGTHSYTFRAQSDRDAATSFALDSIVCSKGTPAVATNMTVDFDRGFIPPETKGAWLVDNAVDTYSDGSNTDYEAAIHPPPLLANAPSEMTFDCGKSAHSELTFYIRRVASGPSLDFLVDGARRYLFSGDDPHVNGPFEKYVFTVPQGAHTYTFRAESPNDASTSFVIDYFQCKDVTPAAAANASIDFDKGYIPPEVQGGWLVDNAIDTYSDGSTSDDEAAVHPPALQANTPVEMTFDCGKNAHTELSFYVRRLSSGPTLDLLIDGTRRYLFSGDEPHDNGPFEKHVIDVPQGTHTYTFRAESANAIATSFVVDFLQCKNVTPVPASNASIDFDKGYIPPEVQGSWVVDSVVDTYSDGTTTTDEAAIRPPALQPNTPVEMTFNCAQVAHSKFSFYLERMSSGPTLSVLMDGTELTAPTISSGTGFKKFSYDVAAGSHIYTFRAQSTGSAATSFVVDYLQCTQ